MVKLCIIKSTENPTDWVNGLAVVEKPNRQLRVCLDPWLLINVIKYEHQHLRNFITKIQCLLSLKPRCFLWILTNRSRWGMLTCPNVRYSLRTLSFQKITLRTHSARKSNKKIFCQRCSLSVNWLYRRCQFVKWKFGRCQLTTLW